MSPWRILSLRGKVVGPEEVSQVRFELFVGVVEVALNGSILDDSVYAFDLPVGPRCLGLASRCSIPLRRQSLEAVS